MNDLPFPIGRPLRDRAITLSERSDFPLGAAWVRPALRSVEGPGGTVKGEPRVLQVLVALADARGAVLSRDDLLRLCWEGRIVGDDAVHRAIAEVRRIAAATEAGFEIETVPRVGYRIGGVEWTMPSDALPELASNARSSRRKVLVGGAAVLGLSAFGAAYWLESRKDPEVDALVERGRLVAASGRPGAKAQAEKLFRRALAKDESSAEAWGLLATVVPAEADARETALRAVALDPREPNGRTVLAIQRRDLDDWLRYEDTLQGIVADAPTAALALQYLTLFYQGMGRCRDSLVCNERAIRIEPFNPIHQGRRALKHWIFGRLDQADQVADRALQLWPGEPTVWNARLILYAYTGRVSAAVSLLNDPVARPARLTEPTIRVWRISLAAIASRMPKDIAAAVETNMKAAFLAPGLAANAVMTLSVLGELDAAYRIAEGLLTARGPVVQRSRAGAGRDLYSGAEWGRTQFLFIPATAAFREDARFRELCRATGHVDYWTKRNIWPDDFVRGALRGMAGATSR